MTLESKSCYFGPNILQQECLKTAVLGVFNVDKNNNTPESFVLSQGSDFAFVVTDL